MSIPNCLVCGTPITNDTPYTDMGVCGACVRHLANQYCLKHSGAPSEEFASRTELETYRKNNQKTKKHTIKQSVKTLVFERDLYRCQWCSTHLNLCIDHIEPRSKGGSDKIENLQTLCRTCNSQKGAL